MLEVLLGLLCLTCVGLECREMNAGAKVDLIDEEALLEELDGLLVVLLLLMNHTEMVVGVHISHRLLESLLEASNGLLHPVPLLKDAAHAHQGIRVVLIVRESAFEVLLRVIKSVWVLHQYLTELGKHLNVVGVKGESLLQVLDSATLVTVLDVDHAGAVVGARRLLVELDRF